MKPISISLGRIFMILGGVLLLIGSFLPWNVQHVGQDITRIKMGIENGGVLTIIGGVIILGFSIFWQNKHKDTFCLIIAIISFLEGVFLIYRCFSEQWIWINDPFIYYPVAGFYLCLSGSIICLVGAFVAFQKKEISTIAPAL